MKLLGTTGQAFIPMLEYYFGTKIKVDEETPILKLYRSIQTRSFNESRCIKTIKVGLGASNYIKANTDYLLITKVSEVILILTNKVVLPVGTIILTTLRTHSEELKKFANNLCIYLDYYNEELNNLADLDQSIKLNLLINPKSETEITELLRCKAIIKYKNNCYLPSDDNYANEFDEIYHIARILKVPVYTAISTSEVTYLLNKCTK